MLNIKNQKTKKIKKNTDEVPDKKSVFSDNKKVARDLMKSKSEIINKKLIRWEKLLE